MRAAATVLMMACLAWGQEEAGCAQPKSAVRQTICANPRLRALDEEFEKKFAEADRAGTILDPETDQRLRKRWDREMARCDKPDVEHCLRAAYERRFVFLKNLRVSVRLEKAPAETGAALEGLRTDELTKSSIYELMTFHPVLGPVTASLIGANWMFWAELGAEPGARLQALPGGRWLVGRAAKADKDSHHDLYMAIDLRDRKLSFVYYQDSSSELYEPFREVRWLSTAGEWPAEASAVLSPLGGRVWQAGMRRLVGLPSTRMPVLPRQAPDCTGVRDQVERTICAHEPLRDLDQDVSALWDDLLVLHLIGEVEHRDFRRVWHDENVECAKRGALEACLQRYLEDRKVFVQSERIAKGLDELPGHVRESLADVGKDLPNSPQELLTHHPVVAPLAASIIGPEWLSWALTGDGYVVALPGKRWIIARGHLVHNVGNMEVYLALDTVSRQMSMIWYHETSGEHAMRELKWASTSGVWPAEATAVLAETGGGAFANGMQRQIGLSATRVRSNPAKPF